MLDRAPAGNLARAVVRRQNGRVVRPRVLVIAALVAHLACPAPAAAQAAPAWLASTEEERFEPEVVSWRRSVGWTSELISAALDERRPREARERALALLGATGDDAAVLQALAELQMAGDPHLAPHVARALGRIWARQRALEAIRLVAPGGDGARELAARLDAEALFEAYALGRDPLFSHAAEATRLIGAALPHDPSIDEQLVALARAGRPDVRDVALDALLARGRPQSIAAGLVAALAVAADEPEGPGRATVLATVARLPGPEAQEAFCRRAFATSVPEPARALAARALGRAGAAMAAPWLRAQLRGAGPELSAAAAAALVRLGAAEPELARALLEAALAGHAGARDAAEGLIALAPDRRDPLLRAGLSDPDPERRQRALELVHAAAPRSLAPALSDLVRSPDAPWAARHQAVLALGRVGDAIALRALAWAAGQVDGGPEVQALRRAAIDALAACAPAPSGRDDPDARAARQALEAALDDRDPAVRVAALGALAAWGDPAGGAAVAARLARPARSTAERIAQVRACERLGLRDDDAVARVLALPGQDPDPELAMAVLSFLRALDDAQAVPVTLELLSHRSASVRRAAGAELRRRRSGGGPDVDEGAPLFSPDHSRAVRAWREWWERRRQ